MKIEFCCEEIKGARISELFKGGNILLGRFFVPKVVATCPYCGSKIEITVRKEGE